MSDKYRVVFASLNEGVSAAEAGAKLSQRLKIPESKVHAFFANKPLFSPADKEKSSKQVKLLHSMGIQTKLQPVNNGTDPVGQAQRDERLFGALDYITSSLIRIEERLEELEQKLTELPSETGETSTEQWQEDDLFEELEEQLLIADVGMDTTMKIIGSLTEKASRRDLKDGEALYELPAG